MKNKILSFVIVLCMLFGILVMPVGAENTEGDFTYYVTESKEAIISSVNPQISGHIVIPETTNDGYNVIGIDSQAFDGCANNITLSLPKTLEWIDGYAFARCPLISLELDSENLYFKLVDGILYSADMTKLVYASPRLTGDFVTPDSVTTVCDGAFVFSQFDSITISDNVTTMMTSAYRGEALWENDGYYGRVFANALCKHITIGKNVQKLGRCLVYRCPLLEDITILGDKTIFEDDFVIDDTGNGYGDFQQGSVAKLRFYANSFAEEYAKEYYRGEWEYLETEGSEPNHSGESSGGSGSGGGGLQQLPAPKNLRWNEDENGQAAYGSISWDSVENCEGEYYITVYRNGEDVFHTSWGELYYGDRQSVDVVHSNIFNESGIYTFSVVAEGDGIQWVDSEPVMSGGFHFTAPNQKLETPTELQWIENGILRHKAVENAGGYLYEVYNQNKKSLGILWDPPYNTLSASATGYAEKDLSKYMIEVSGWEEDLKGIYVTVTALTYNINEYQNSDKSVFSAIYNIEAAESAAESSMNSLLEDIDNETSTAAEALDSFLEQMEDSNIENTDIAISMQQNEQFVNSISRLEAAYCEETGIEVAIGNNEEDNEYLETRGIDVSKVTIVGAALNSQDGADVNINFSKVEEMPQVNESFYKNTVAVNIGIEGVKDAEKLDIPIQIKMPVPTGVLPERLVIIHYHADGTSEEIHPAVSYDGEGKAYVTFVLTSFSTFVFCNEQDPAPAQTGGGGGGGGAGASTYTVKLDTNGGNELKNIIVKKGQSIGTIQTPQKKGYVFDGWYADKDLTKLYSADEKVTASTTLYAGWKVDPVRQMTLTIGDKNATVFGEAKSNDVAPIIRNDRTMLPIRFIAEALGAEVGWDSENKVVTITNDKITIEITIDKSVAVVNGKEISLDSPAFIEKDRTFLPLRFVSENLGAEVDWVEETKQVVITKPIDE